MNTLLHYVAKERIETRSRISLSLPHHILSLLLTCLSLKFGVFSYSNWLQVCASPLYLQEYKQLLNYHGAVHWILSLHIYSYFLIMDGLRISLPKLFAVSSIIYHLFIYFQCLLPLFTNLANPNLNRKF